MTSDPDDANTTADGADDQDFEVLTSAPVHVPRWLILVAAAVLVGAAVTAVVRTIGGAGSATSAAGASTRPTAATRPAVSTLPPTAPGVQSLDTGPGQPVDLALGSRHLYVLSSVPSAPFSVTKLDIGDGHVDGRVEVTGEASRVAADESLGRLWVMVSDGPRRAHVQEFDASTLRPTTSVPVGDDIQGMAILGNRLWLATGNAGLYSLTPGAAAVVRAPLHCGCTAITADAAGRRLVVAVGAWPSRVVSYRPQDGVVVTGESLDVGKTSLAVVRGAVWVAGYGNDRVARLDSRTLRRAGAASQVSAGDGAGDVVWPGESVVWVAGDQGTLRCVEPQTARLLAEQPYGHGTVVSRDGAVFDVGTGVVRRLLLRPACAG